MSAPSQRIGRFQIDFEIGKRSARNSHQLRPAEPGENQWHETDAQKHLGGNVEVDVTKIIFVYNDNDTTDESNCSS